MRAFTFERAATPQAASSAMQHPGARFIAGGTNLLDLMKLEIETPSHLIDVNGLALDSIEPTAGAAYVLVRWCAIPIWRQMRASGATMPC